MSNLRTASILATLSAILLAFGGASSSATSSECRATRAAYGALKNGMSYRRTVEILGCPGRRTTRMAIGKSRRTTYTWSGTGTYGANLTLSFRNGHLTSKSQLGLK